MHRLYAISIVMACLITTGCAGDSAIPEITRPQDYTAARASSANPTGANRDHIRIPPGETAVLADLTGPGIIKHCWFTIGSESPTYLSDLVLRITWDGSDAPAVESPIGPFFALGHNECDDVVSAPIAVMAAKANYIKSPPGRAAFNCYFPMPFHRRAVFEVVNNSTVDEPVFFYHIDWQRHETLPADVRYFHARHRTEHTSPGPEPDDRNVTGGNNYVIFETNGRGHYVGCTLHVEAHQAEPGKWYEGDDMIVVDSQPLHEGILGTGSEDYFNMAWGVRRPYQAPYFGTGYHRWNPDEPDMAQYGRFSVYRWHWLDPIPFDESIRVSIEHGHNNDAGNRYASVAYWYADRTGD
jgi:hypothetical protein